MKAHFEGHVGELDPDTNKVRFYGIKFDSICDAIPFIRQVDPNDELCMWYYRGHKGIKTSIGTVYVCNVWFTNEDEAEYYIDKLYDGRRRLKKNPSYPETLAW